MQRLLTNFEIFFCLVLLFQYLSFQGKQLIIIFQKMGNKTVQKLNKPENQITKRMTSLKQLQQQNFQENQTPQLTKNKSQYFSRKQRKWSSQTEDQNQVSAKENKSILNEEDVLDVSSFRNTLTFINHQKSQKGQRDQKNEKQIKQANSRQKQKQNIEQSSAQKNKIIYIFDWDDTLFFTTHYCRQPQPFKQSKMNKSMLEDFDRIVYQILSYCLKHGQIFIVTASLLDWVKQSSYNFLPNSYQVLFNSDKISLFSSRQIVEVQNKGHVLIKEKGKIFEKIIKSMIVEIETNLSQKSTLQLICVGDSEDEISASNNVYIQFHSKFSNFILKTIKLKANPSFEDLKEQLQLLLGKLQKITNSHKKMTIKLERANSSKQDNNCQNQNIVPM